MAEHVIAEFHDPRSGRLDAQRIADVLELPLAALAKGLGVTRAALARRPTAAAAQPGLRQLESGWAGLRRVLGDDHAIRAWLHAARPELEGHAPIDLLRAGSVRALADYVESALAGQPS